MDEAAAALVTRSLQHTGENSMTHYTALSNEELVRIAVEIVRETIRRGGNAELAIEPYNDEVRTLIKIELTHSERKAAGLIDEADPLQSALMAMVIRREQEAYGKVADTVSLLTDRAMAYYGFLTA